MEIEGSCYCGQVKFTAVSHTPYPYMRCYCSMCRKTAGGGGYSINIMAQADTFKVEGEAHAAVHDCWTDDDEHPGKLRTSVIAAQSVQIIWTGSALPYGSWCGRKSVQARPAFDASRSLSRVSLKVFL